MWWDLQCNNSILLLVVFRLWLKKIRTWYLFLNKIVWTLYKNRIYFIDTAHELISERTACHGKSVYVGRKTLQECALVCANRLSALFVVSRQDGGYCHGDKCRCYCYPRIFKDGICPHKYKWADDLHRIRQSTINGQCFSFIYIFFSHRIV